MTQAAPTLGLDFGTTNSVAVLAGADGRTQAMSFRHDNAAFEACR